MESNMQWHRLDHCRREERVHCEEILNQNQNGSRESEPQTLLLHVRCHSALQPPRPTPFSSVDWITLLSFGLVPLRVSGALGRHSVPTVPLTSWGLQGQLCFHSFTQWPLRASM